MDVCYDCRPVPVVTFRAVQVYLYVRKGHEYHIKCNYACVRYISLQISNVRPSGAALLCVWNFPMRLPSLKLEDEVFISKVFLWSVSSSGGRRVASPCGHWNTFVLLLLTFAPIPPPPLITLRSHSHSERLCSSHLHTHPRCVFMSQCAPCFTPLAELCWPSGCEGKGKASRHWSRLPRRFRVVPLKPTHQTLSLSTARKSVTALWRTVNLWPPLSPIQQRKHWSQSCALPPPRDGVQHSFGSAGAPVCAQEVKRWLDAR